MSTTSDTPLAGAVATCRALPSETRTPGVLFTMGELIDAYMAVYEGRDQSRAYRLLEWQQRIGHLPILDFTDDHAFDALEAIATAPARIYMGRDANGNPIHRAKGKRSNSTLNRYQQALAAVCTWGIKRRRVPKGWVNPMSELDQRPENKARTRFLSDDERARLLVACKAASWARLYALVLLALTTGARRGELTRLRWCDIDVERGEAHVRETKNGQPRVLPLVGALREQLRGFLDEDVARFKLGTPSQLVFGSRIRPKVAFNFEEAWREALRASRVRDFRFHDLRHSCASYLAQSGASLLEIADVLGHKQLRMAMRYSHLTIGTKRALVARVLGHIA